MLACVFIRVCRCVSACVGLRCVVGLRVCVYVTCANVFACVVCVCVTESEREKHTTKPH